MQRLSLRPYKPWIVGAFWVLAVGGCDTFLQPEPQTFEANENFYQSDEQFLQAVNGAYARLQDWVLEAYVLEEARSDNTTFDNGLNRGQLRALVRIDWFVLDTSEPQISSAWNAIYRGIKDVNSPLSYIEGGIASGRLDQELGRRLEGELKFLRAFFYFTAVRLWGDVPLIVEPLAGGLAAFEIEQRPKEEVFGLIIQDLKDAEAVLPESYNGSDIGRVTSGAAKTLLAKVYLTRAEYAEAEQKLREVVDSNLYALLPTYADIFDPQNKHHAESIYEVQFHEGSEGESSNFIFQFAPVGSFPEIIPTLVGDGTWGRNLPTLQLIEAYEDGDVREAVSIGYFARDGIDVPYIKKWEEASDPDFARANHNWPLLRYADVLLMLAEAINEQGYDPEEPFELLNEVRNRAGLASLTPADLPDQQAFRQALMHERRVELAFENHRWFDLIRFGVAVETMRAHGQLAMENPSTPFTPVMPLDPNAYQVEPFMLLYPIPEDELAVNPNMVQNPGY